MLQTKYHVVNAQLVPGEIQLYLDYSFPVNRKSIIGYKITATSIEAGLQNKTIGTLNMSRVDDTDTFVDDDVIIRTAVTRGFTPLDVDLIESRKISGNFILDTKYVPTEAVNIKITFKVEKNV